MIPSEVVNLVFGACRCTSTEQQQGCISTSSHPRYVIQSVQVHQHVKKHGTAWHTEAFHKCMYRKASEQTTIRHALLYQGRTRVPLLALARHRLVLSLLELTRHLPGPILRRPEPMLRLRVCLLAHIDTWPSICSAGCAHAPVPLSMQTSSG